MRIRLRCVGKVRDRALASAIAEYEDRVRRYWTFETVAVREERAAAITPEQVREREGSRLLADIEPGDHLVACDAAGWQPTSEELADWLRRERERATRDLTFVIGGAYGLDDDVIRRARTRLSFSRWTLPHELARLVLTEQLYRAGTILRGEPYHK